MSRKIWAIFVLAAEIGLGPPAFAQMGCPPGQTFIPTLNRCIAGGNSACPPGTHYDADLRRCLGVPRNKCADNEMFDTQQDACVPAAK